MLALLYMFVGVSIRPKKNYVHATTRLTLKIPTDLWIFIPFLKKTEIKNLPTDWWFYESLVLLIFSTHIFFFANWISCMSLFLHCLFWNGVFTDQICYVWQHITVKPLLYVHWTVMIWMKVYRAFKVVSQRCASLYYMHNVNCYFCVMSK